MSKTIVTKNGNEFFTNIGSERLIGKLCHSVGAKCFRMEYVDTVIIDMSYEMTEQETIDTANRLESLLPNCQELFSDYQTYFAKGSTYVDLKLFIEETIQTLRESGGYECLG